MPVEDDARYGEQTDNAVGWFGKVPSVGDFVRRGLPDRFVDRWDDWLQRSVIAGRRALGGSFDAALQAFPTWRFYVAPGVIGPVAWCGVMQASCDRVGRTFPFTIVQPLPAGPDCVCDTAWLEGQLEAFARTAVSALDQTSLERFERLVASLPLPPVAEVADQGGLGDVLRGMGRSHREVAPMSARLHHWVRGLAERDLSRVIAGRWLWWIPPTMEEDAGAALIAQDPLPDELLQTLLLAV